MNDDLHDQIYNSMNLKETDELIDIWQQHNSNEWTDSSFRVVEELLRDRLGELPSQSKFDDKGSERELTGLEFEKEYLPIWCEGCNSEGYIFVDSPELSHFVVCKTCGWETSDVWCPKCGMGGAFVKSLSKHPSHWVCPHCKTRYPLPNGFYEKPIKIFAEEELPLIVRERIEKDIQANRPFSAKNWRSTLIAQAIVLLEVAVVLAIGLLPMALVFTPLPWTIPGFVATLLVFAVWWWIIGRVLKNVRERFAKRSS